MEVTERKTKIDWAIFIKKIADEWYKNATKIILVMDNLATHKASALYEAFDPKKAKRIWDRFEFVYTPKHGSWFARWHPSPVLRSSDRKTLHLLGQEQTPGFCFSAA